MREIGLQKIALTTASVVNDDGHKAMLTGTFVCGSLPGVSDMTE